MPLYEFVCPECETSEERICRHEDIAGQECRCGRPLVRIITGARLVGPTDTKPEKINGREFTTKAAVDSYIRANPGLDVLSKSDSRVKAVLQKNRHVIESRANASGFRSEKDRLASVKKESIAKGVQ